MLAFVWACVAVVFAEFQGGEKSAAFKLGEAIGTFLVFTIVALLIWKLAGGGNKPKKPGAPRRPSEDG